jgi:hypothetical protein
MPPIEKRPVRPRPELPAGVFSYAGATREIAMNRNTMMLVIGVLVIAVAVLGYQAYQERQKTGVEISIGNSGISIEKK